jgi:lipopolysaccharide transport system permease protein
MNPHILITSEPDPLWVYLKKIWRSRALILTFARRDLKVKYAQTYLGLAWTVLQPVTAITLYTFFFGYLLDMDSGSVPFVLYVTSGLLAWNFFAYNLFHGTSSIQESALVIKKIYFPKAVLPLSKLGVGLVELVICLVLIIPLFIWHGIIPSWHIVFLPVAIFITALNALTVVFWISALSYRFRDLIHTIPYLVNFGIWVTPVFYSRSLIPEMLQPLVWINPMAASVEFWRWCYFDQYDFSPLFFIPIALNFFLVVLGFWVYSRNETKFSDFA